MRKIKGLLAAIILICSASLFADDFDWSKCWCNYGAGIEQGDMLLSVDGGINFTSLANATNTNFWFTPSAVVDFQIVQPIWVLPFSFGGYLGYDAYGYRYDVYGSEVTYSVNNIYVGGTIAYHVMLPVDKLDVYATTKLGARVAIANSGYGTFDFGTTLGASWYLTDLIGLNVEFGIPVSKFGVVFKF